jgi:undecaprenyl-diphosphatase
LALKVKAGDWLIVFCAKYVPYFMTAAAIFFIFYFFRDWKKKLLVFFTASLSVILSRGILTEVIRFLYARPRPFKVLGFEPLIGNGSPAFPSGHAAAFFALAAALFYFNRRWGFWFFVFAILNAFGRVVAGVHWPSDILGGVFLGLFSFWIVKRILGLSPSDLREKA